MEKKILHLVTDEKFTDYAIKQFEAPEMYSEFVLIPSNFDVDCEVKAIDKCKVVKQNSIEYKSLLSNLDEYCAIIFHGMFWPNWQIPVLNAIPNGVKVAWVFWAGEIYGQPDLAGSFLAPLDRLICNLHGLFRKLIGKYSQPVYGVPKEYYSKVDYCLTAMYVEYEFAKKYLNRPDMKYIWYNYYSIEETVGSVYDKQCAGGNIWVGNSATTGCNHFSTLPLLKKMDLSNREVIVPLSYGSPWVKKRVNQLGKVLFKKQFVPLLDYLPRDEYNAKMLSCSTMIQPYYATQGAGNILTGLWLGMRVYVTEKGLLYDYLKQIGVKFFTIEHDLRKDNPDVFAPLSQADIDHNRKALLAETGLQRTIEANKALVEELLK